MFLNFSFSLPVDTQYIVTGSDKISFSSDIEDDLEYRLLFSDEPAIAFLDDALL